MKVGLLPQVGLINRSTGSDKNKQLASPLLKRKKNIYTRTVGLTICKEFALLCEKIIKTQNILIGLPTSERKTRKTSHSNEFHLVPQNSVRERPRNARRRYFIRNPLSETLRNFKQLFLLFSRSWVKL